MNSFTGPQKQPISDNGSSINDDNIDNVNNDNSGDDEIVNKFEDTLIQEDYTNYGNILRK